MSNTDVRTIAGIAGARKIGTHAESAERQTVTITEGKGEVVLDTSTSNFAAGLTVDQARTLAAQLMVAAEHVAGQQVAEVTQS